MSDVVIETYKSKVILNLFRMLCAVAVVFAFLVDMRVSVLAAEPSPSPQSVACQNNLTNQNVVRARSLLTASKKFAEELVKSGGGGGVIFVEENISTMLCGGECFIEIPVYLDGHDSLHLFATFAISLNGKVLVMDVDGDYVE